MTNLKEYGQKTHCCLTAGPPRHLPEVTEENHKKNSVTTNYARSRFERGTSWV